MYCVQAPKTWAIIDAAFPVGLAEIVMDYVICDVVGANIWLDGAIKAGCYEVAEKEQYKMPDDMVVIGAAMHHGYWPVVDMYIKTMRGCTWRIWQAVGDWGAIRGARYVARYLDEPIDWNIVLKNGCMVGHNVGPMVAILSGVSTKALHEAKQVSGWIKHIVDPYPHTKQNRYILCDLIARRKADS